MPDAATHRPLGDTSISLELTEDEIDRLPEEQRRLYLDLPATLSLEERWRLNRHANVSGQRWYTYRGLKFSVPDGVFRPGGTSEVVFDALWNEEVRVRGKRILIMGVGAGVEAFLCARKGAKAICGVDIHPGSVEASHLNYRRNAGQGESGVPHFLVSDLFASLRPNVRADLILFNPPAVPIKVESEALTRASFSGTALVLRFFRELTTEQRCAPSGSVVVILSNTADLRAIVAYAVRLGWGPRLLKLKGWASPFEPVKTHLLEFQRAFGDGCTAGS